MGILKCFAKVIELSSSLVFILGTFTFFFAISLARKKDIYIFKCSLSYLFLAVSIDIEM